MRRYTIEVTEFQKAALAAVLAIYAHNSDVPQSFGGEDFRPPVLIGDLMELVAVARLEGVDDAGPVPVPVKGICNRIVNGGVCTMPTPCPKHDPR